MKLRNGFVSNSSSSSFIVNLGREMPKDNNELKKALGLEKCVGWDDVSIEEVLSKMFEKFRQFNSREELLKHVMDEERDNAHYSVYKMFERERDKIWNMREGKEKKRLQEELDAKMKAGQERIARQNIQGLLDEFDPETHAVVVGEFEDSDHVEQVIEQGDYGGNVFRNVPHKVYNHH